MNNFEQPNNNMQTNGLNMSQFVSTGPQETEEEVYVSNDGKRKSHIWPIAIVLVLLCLGVCAGVFYIITNKHTGTSLPTVSQKPETPTEKVDEYVMEYKPDDKTVSKLVDNSKVDATPTLAPTETEKQDNIKVSSTKWSAWQLKKPVAAKGYTKGFKRESKNGYIYKEKIFGSSETRHPKDEGTVWHYVMFEKDTGKYWFYRWSEWKVNQKDPTKEPDNPDGLLCIREATVYRYRWVME